MKKLKLLVMLLAAVLVLPFAVMAEEGDEAVATEETSEAQTEATDQSNEVKVYFFRGEGCPHCQEAEEWFKSIEGDYGSKFEIVDYETWYNEDNAKLMEKVAASRDETADGVPYIIIGDQSWSGFDTSYEDEILSKIDEVFAQPVSDRADALANVDNGKNAAGKKDSKDSGSDVLALVIVLLVIGLGGFGIYKARSTAK